MITIIRMMMVMIMTITMIIIIAKNNVDDDSCVSLVVQTVELRYEPYYKIEMVLKHT